MGTIPDSTAKDHSYSEVYTYPADERICSVGGKCYAPMKRTEIKQKPVNSGIESKEDNQGSLKNTKISLL